MVSVLAPEARVPNSINKKAWLALRDELTVSRLLDQGPLSPFGPQHAFRVGDPRNDALLPFESPQVQTLQSTTACNRHTLAGQWSVFEYAESVA